MKENKLEKKKGSNHIKKEIYLKLNLLMKDFIYKLIIIFLNLELWINGKNFIKKNENIIDKKFLFKKYKEY